MIPLPRTAKTNCGKSSTPAPRRRGSSPSGTDSRWAGAPSNPATATRRILRSQVLKAAGPAASSRPGDGPEVPVWSVSCFVVAPGHRRSGVAAALLHAAVGHAVAHGAGIVEGYPVNPELRPKAGPADLYQGTLKLFLAAGFEVVSDAVPGRAVVRLVARS